MGFNRRYATYKTDTIDWKPVKSQRSLESSKSPRKGNRAVFGLMCLTPVITLYLGYWQLKRLKWKNNLVADCEDRLTYKPLPLPKSLAPEDVKDFEYRRVVLNGSFDYDNEMFVGPRLMDGEKGYLLVTPFIRSNGAKPILVERGWIAEDKVDIEKRKLRHLSVPQVPVSITCLLRVVPPKGMFHIDHEYGSKMFRYIDLDVMSSQSGSLPIYAQAIEDLHDHPEWAVSGVRKQESKPFWKFWQKEEIHDFHDPKVGESAFDESLEFSPHQFMSAGVPIGKIPKVDYKNNHLQYLVTWWGLSFCSTILLFMILKSKRITSPLADKLKHARRVM